MRAEARAAFERHCEEVTAKLRCEPSGLLPRVLFPGLEEAILLHRCRHAAARAFERRRLLKSWCKGGSGKVGHGELRTGILWIARMERVCVSNDSQKKVKSNVKDEVCFEMLRLPKWLCNIRATKYAAYIATKTNCIEVHSTVPSTSTSEFENVREEPVPLKPIAPISDNRGYAQHVARMAVAHANCAKNIVTRTTPKLDDAKSMIRRYAGMPDELYRRRHGRAFARWRRQQREADTVARAEAEMARRRGLDRLQTQRAEMDARPFAFDGGEHAYAYNTRITEAPRLRAQMVRKYAAPAPQPLVPQLQGREKALKFADSAPMFHTRVMDRFRR